MKHVVSVSLGSSQRDRSVETSFAGVPFRVDRLGTDGDVGKAEDLIAERDVKVDAIGLGGLDRYLVAGKRRYELRDASRMARNAVDIQDVESRVSNQSVLVIRWIESFGVVEVIKVLPGAGIG